MSFPQPPSNPGSPFDPTASSEPGMPPPPGSMPQQEAWGQSPSQGVPMSQLPTKPMGKPLIAALCTGLFLSGCVSGCVTGAALVNSKSGASPAPTVTKTVKASEPKVKPDKPSDTPSSIPSEAAPKPASEELAPAAPAPEPPAPEAPATSDPTSLTQTVKHGTLTITPFTQKMDELTGTHGLLCTTLTAVNSSKDSWSVNPLEFQLSAPDHSRSNINPFGGGQVLHHAELIPGDTVTGELCFEDTGQRGAYTLIWSPFLSDSVRWNVQIQ